MFRWKLLILALIVAQGIRIGFKVSPTAGEQLTASDLTWLGQFKVPYSSPGADTGNDDMVFMTGRDVGGTAHLFVLQSRQTTANHGAWAPVEISDPGTYDNDSNHTNAPTASIVKNWGYSSGSYDFYRGKYGDSYDASGNLIDNSATYWPVGISWHDYSGPGSTCCFYMAYGDQYGNYTTQWNLVAVDLTNAGTGITQPTGLSTTAYGPFRTCVGWVTAAQVTQECGVMRAGYVIEMPDGSMGFSQGQSRTQQGRLNKGPSLWGGGVEWIGPSTDSSWGSARGSAAYRTTDIVPTDNFISHYSQDGQVNNITGTVFEVRHARRPSKPTGTFANGASNYYFEGYDCASGIDPTFGEVDPDAYDGVGSWTQRDQAGGTIYIPGTKRGYLSVVTVSVGHVWYMTNSCHDFLRTAQEIADNGGPWVCPRHAVAHNTGASSPGPITDLMRPAFMLYNPDDLTPTSDFTADPEEWVWMDDIAANMRVAPMTALQGGVLHGPYFHPPTRKLFVLAPRANSADFGPLVQVFQVAGDALPSPWPMPLAAGLAVMSLGSLLRRRVVS